MIFNVLLTLTELTCPFYSPPRHSRAPSALSQSCTESGHHRSSINRAVGGVAAIVAALLRDGTAPEKLGPVRCCVISPAAVFSGDLSEACRPFTTSLILRYSFLFLRYFGHLSALTQLVETEC